MTTGQTNPALMIRLRDVAPPDIDVLFPFQIDPKAIHMAAFTWKDLPTRESFGAWWDRLLANPAIIKRVVVCNRAVVGSILKFEREGVPEVTYWFARDYWGQGIATAALGLFLPLIPTRPLHARVAMDNMASRRVLEKCGFRVTAQEQGFAEARAKVIPELILTLES